MRRDHWTLALLLMTLAGVVFGLGMGSGQAVAQNRPPAQKQDPQAAIAQVVVGLQSDLEGSSSSSFLGRIDRSRFDDFPRFQDSVERLTSQDEMRVFFRQTSSTVKEDQAQTVLDAEMEMTRKDSTLQAQQRKQQITIDLARTSRGWKITNITPRDFFEPL